MASEHEPVSWLTLERYALGELDPEERAQVEARLAASEVDRACLEQILQDRSELSLPGPASATNVSSLAQARAARRPSRWLLLCAGLSAAAALLLVVRHTREGAETAPYDGVKGSDVALRLISERQGAEPRSFGEGERFKVEVTCPAQLSASLRLLVFQAGEVYEPLPPPAAFRCGNLVPWPGAFALDGAAPAEVCLVWGENTAPKQRTELGREAVCTRLEAR